jgi:hypothetical protein
VKPPLSIASTAVVVSASLLCHCPLPASAQVDSLTEIVALQAKADQAERRDRCFLYAVLVSRLIEQAGQQFGSGDQQRASDTLKQVQRYADEIRLDVADDSKRLKNTELLMERSSHRLNEILHEASSDDRPNLEATLKQLNQLQKQLLIQIFKK